MTKSEDARIAVLENENKHMKEAFDILSDDMKQLSLDLRELKDLLAQAKGAKWMLLVVAGLGGGAGIGLHKIAAMLNLIPLK